VAQRTWDRPTESAATSAANTNASDGLQGEDNPSSSRERLHCKVAMEHRADTGGAVTVDQVEAPLKLLPLWLP
jgi:hypothetical protein